MSTNLFIPLLGELLAKSALLLGAAILVLAALRNASAALRSLVWVTAFSAVLLLPATLAFRPAWSLPVVRIASTAPPRPELITAAYTDELLSKGVSPGPAISTAPARQCPDWRVLLAGLWASGAGLILLRRSLGTVRLLRVRRASRICDDSRLNILTQEVLQGLGVRRAVELRLNSTGGIPVTWGTMKPVLLMPLSALGWSDEQAAAALRHEAAHIARFDHLTRWLTQIACALYWPNPLVWIAARASRTEQEKAADDVVLRAGTDAEEYVGQLFDVARSIPSRTRVEFSRCAVAMAHPSTLEKRMLAIVDDRRDRRPISLRAGLAGALAVVLSLGISTAGTLFGEENLSAKDNREAEPLMIAVDARLVDLKNPIAETETELSPLVRAADKPAQIVIGDAQSKAVIRALNGRSNTDVLAAPRIISKSAQRASIESGREFRYPTEWERDGEVWTPKNYATRNTGITLNLESAIRPDGTIELWAQPIVVEFDGFQDLDAPEQKGLLVEVAGEHGSPVKGHRLRAVFSERRASHRVMMKPGQTLVFLGLPRKEPALNAGKAEEGDRQLLVFLTPQLVKLSGETVDAAHQGSNPSAAAPSISAAEQAKSTEAAFKALLGGGPIIKHTGNDTPDAGLGTRPLARGGAAVAMGGSAMAGGSQVGSGEAIAGFAPAPFALAPNPKEVGGVISINSDKIDANGNGEMVATGNVVIDTGSVLIRTDRAEVQAKKVTTPDPLESLILPEFIIKEATVSEAVEKMLAAARAQGVEAGAIALPKFTVEPRITLSLKKVPFMVALKYVTGLSNTAFKRVPGGFEIQQTPLPVPPGYVRSPYAPDAALVDVRGLAPGTEIKDPHTGKTFRIP